MPRDPDRAFLGHPRGLSTLFFTEMWERLSYYGARTILFFFMTAEVADGGRGMSGTSAGLVMALYMSSVYLLSLPGGWIADRFLGQRRAVTLGAVGIIIGNAMLAAPVDSLFYLGLCVIALGTGLLKPNISTIVGQLYKPDDVRRDAGYTIYYIGINVGAAAAPIVCTFLAQSDTFKAFLASHDMDPGLCWRFGFAAPAVGMTLGLMQYLAFYKWMGEAGLHPAKVEPTIPKATVQHGSSGLIYNVIIGLASLAGLVLIILIVRSDMAPNEKVGNVFGVGLALGSVILFCQLLRGARNGDEKKRIIGMIPLFIGAIGFFGVFEQASTTLSDFAEHYVHREWLGVTIQAGNYQFANALFIILLAPVFSIIWVRAARARKEPHSVNKFGIGMIFVAVSFMVMIPTIGAATYLQEHLATLGKMPFALDSVEQYTEPHRVSATYLIGVYLFSTLAELCISPVGLSSMNKLAPTRMAGLVMGTWFLATSIGNYLAGRAAGFSEARGYGFLFWFLIIAALVISAALFIVAPIIKRMANDAPKETSEEFRADEPEKPRGDDKKDADVITSSAS